LRVSAAFWEGLEIMRRATPARSGRAAALGLEDTEAPLKRFLKRNMIGAAGLAVIAASAALASALATWSVTDPSFSHATTAPVRNALGWPGAVIADVFMQAIGLAAAVFLVPVVLWGWRLLSARASRIALRRLGAWVAGTLLAAGALAALPVPASWPLPTGLGGFLGDFVHMIPAMLTDDLTPGMAMIVGGLGLGVPATILMLRAAGWLGREPAPVLEPLPEPSRHARSVGAVPDYDADDDEDDDHGGGRWQALVGAVAHMGLLAGATARRLVFRRRAARRGDEDFDLPAYDEDDDWDDAPRGNMEDDDPVGRHGGFSALRRKLADRLMPPEDDGLDAFYPQGADAEVVAEPEPPVPSIDDLPDFDEDDDPDAPMSTPLPRAIAGPASRDEPPAGRVVPPAARPRPGKRVVAEAQPSFLRQPGVYELPPLHLLAEPKNGGRQTAINTDALEQNARILEGVLEDFGVRGEIIEVRPGPVVTLYELEPAPGIKSSRVIGLADDIARSMSAISARVAVIPGKNAIGIELPNQRREMVFLRELLAASDYEKSKAKLALTLGKTIGGEPVIADLARMPHLLVAGTTGSGKSVAINTMILSLLYRLDAGAVQADHDRPEDAGTVVYDGIPASADARRHRPQEGGRGAQMDRPRDGGALQEDVEDGRAQHRRLQHPRRPGPGKGRDLHPHRPDRFRPRDRRADLRGRGTAAGADALYRRHRRRDGRSDDGRGQGHRGRYPAAGADGARRRHPSDHGDAAPVGRRHHRHDQGELPDPDLLPGHLEDRQPHDSRRTGRGTAAGQGDMLYMAGGGRIQRVHGPFVADDEVEHIVTHLKRQGTPQYLEAVTAEDEVSDSPYDQLAGGGGDEGNDLYDKAVAIVLRDKKASTSYIQRRLSIGYNRAASIIERMEQEGLVGAANHAGKREILVQNGVEDDF
jgi:hypothetical protein